MELEQVRPNKPNFGLVVTISVAAIVCIFAAVLLVMHFSGHDLIKHHVDTPDQSRTSALPIVSTMRSA